MESPKISLQVKELLADLDLSSDRYLKICRILESEIQRGLSKSTHSTAAVKMFPSFVTRLPSGKECGRYLALDLGGTNFRILLVDMPGGASKPKVQETVYAVPVERMNGKGEELFAYIASTLKDFLGRYCGTELCYENSPKLPLGFTFSFPCVQENLNIAKLVQWTKGFTASGVEGKNVAELLQAAIDQIKLPVRCVAVVNDTVGTLASCALENPKCAIGLIVGTGTNAAYIEDSKNVDLFDGSDPQVVINMEWGAFGSDGSLDDFRCEFDRQLDAASLYPGKQIFEKMISGMYLGEIARLAMVRLVNAGLLFNGNMPTCLTKPNYFHTRFISETERDPPNLYYTTNYMLTEELGVSMVQPEDSIIVRYVCQLVATRSAYLAGTGIACLLNRMGRKDVTVGIDGSLFKFHPKYQERMTSMIHQLKRSDINFALKLSEDGSGKGAAAIAAATTGSTSSS